MEKSDQLNTNKTLLDLREGWIQIEKTDVEDIINRKDRGNYWWHDDVYVSTLKNGKLMHYKINETEVLSNKKNEEALTTIKIIKKEKKSDLLTPLSLSRDNLVTCTAEAFERAKYSNKTKFWFISKGKRKAVIVLDFSKGKEPEINQYPLDKYKIKLKAVEV